MNFRHDFAKWKGFSANDCCLADMGRQGTRSDDRELLATWLALLADVKIH
jgi:hypothetical protein